MIAPCAFWIPEELLGPLMDILRQTDHSAFESLFRNVQPVGGMTEDFSLLLGEMTTITAIKDIPQPKGAGHYKLQRSLTGAGLNGFLTIFTRDQAAEYCKRLAESGLLDAPTVAEADGNILYHGELEKLRSGFTYLRTALDIPGSFAAVALWSR
jgi:hypothetical protein